MLSCRLSSRPPAFQAHPGHRIAASMKRANSPTCVAWHVDFRNALASQGAEPFLARLMRKYPNDLRTRFARRKMLWLRTASENQSGVTWVFLGVAISAKNLNIRSIFGKLRMRRYRLHVMAMQEARSAASLAEPYFFDRRAKNSGDPRRAVSLAPPLPKRMVAAGIPSFLRGVRALYRAMHRLVFGAFSAAELDPALMAGLRDKDRWAPRGWRYLRMTPMRTVRRCCEYDGTPTFKCHSARSADIRAYARAQINRITLPFLGLVEGGI